ncbi:MAG TPA: carboxypeptidase regulatory-like domain-containing protein [Pyrinomonadaceae bacterium]|nr:carboxypeptidase regulatory-like domain-containing protein [Pyrinomonadaceae bacterium]
MSRRITSTRAALAAFILLALANLSSDKWTISMNAQVRTDLGVDASAVVSVIINEVDADTPGTDIAEFIELYDGGAGNTPLDGLVVVLFNGGAANDASYAAFDLDGFATNANGYFTLGNSGVSGVDLVFANGLLQNGPDAVGLFAANAADFPSGTAINTTNIRDALVYSNAATIDAGLLVLLNAGQTQVNENAAGTGATFSMQRVPNGSGGERNTDTYQPMGPTPDGPNLTTTAAAVSISGRVTDASGQGIRNAKITLEGGPLTEPRLNVTSSFGYYSFEGVAAGTFMLTINSKRHTFPVPTRVVMANDNVLNVDFVAEPGQ